MYFAGQSLGLQLIEAKALVDGEVEEKVTIVALRLYHPGVKLLNNGAIPHTIVLCNNAELPAI